MRDPFAQLECAVHRCAHGRLLARRAQQCGDRQLDVVFHETLQARERFGRDKFSIDPQLPRAARGCPARKFAIMTLAVRYQWRQQLDRLAAIVLQQLRDDRFCALRSDRDLAVGAVLGAQPHVDQAQEVIDLGQGGDRALEAAAAGALLDRHRGRNAIDGIEIRPCRGLHELARVGVERFQVAALTLVEQDVERQS